MFWQAPYIIQPSRPALDVSGGVVSVTWDPAHTDTGTTLSGGSLTYTNNASTTSSTRSTAASTTNQKVYYEETITQQNFRPYPGFCNSSLSLSGGIPGLDGPPSNGLSVDESGGVWINGGNTGGVWAGFTTGTLVDLAYDTGNQLLWIRANNGAWNTGLVGTQDPGSGQGGFSTSGKINAGPYYACGFGQAVGDSGTARFDSSSWLHTAPSGFTAL